ncbi:hypothetical protein EV383_2952 [Pseudonocardia sediminis]|uniref:Histidine kinase n=1 Tax=Pseudonocardia sediminis TaxID=1397368 RepID=A0A4Q7UY75_PSEST|nr:hypothetical protein [Pseudonocardia sediminis]RZT86064.1 hypothetical protein EV383_2952 [Pseudonocardia sediminis]
MIRAGLLLLGLLSLVDVAGILLTDGEHPPIAIAAIGTAIGVVSLALLWFAWRGHRGATIGLVLLRLVSAATAVPAFTEPGVPAAARVAAGAVVVLTVVGCGLVVPALRRGVVRSG